MRRRKELNKLVIMTLDESLYEPPKAIDLYNHIKKVNPLILKHEKVPTFRSFVKVLNAFPNVMHQGIKPKRYFIAKKFK